MLDLLRQLGISARRVANTKGGEYHSACPGCGGEDRFHVWPEQPTAGGGRGSFWCRGCEKAGDRIEFMRQFMGMSFREAARACGRELEKRPRGPRPLQPFAAKTAPAAVSGRQKAVSGGVHDFIPNSPPEPSSLWREKLGRFLERCQVALTGNGKALDWLEKRGIDRATAQWAGLGWNPGDSRGRDLYRDRVAWGAPPAEHPDGRKKRLWLPVGLVIPWFAPDGSLLRLRIRRPVADNGPRYYVVPGSGMETLIVYGDRPVLVVVEAELDAILVAARTRAGAVALGSAQTKPTARAHRHLERARQIMVALDFDGPGAAAAAWWLATYPRAERWPVPVGKDPGEAWAAGVDLDAWVSAGLIPALKIRGKGSHRGLPVRAEPPEPPEITAPPCPPDNSPRREPAPVSDPEDLWEVF